MKERVWVVSGTEGQFYDYIKDKPLNSDKKYFYVYSPDTLRGFVNPHGVFVGTWRNRLDIHDIIHQLIISTRTDTSNLSKLFLTLPEQNHRIKTAQQTLEDAIEAASLAMAKRIDSDVLQQLRMSSIAIDEVSAKSILSSFDT